MSAPEPARARQISDAQTMRALAHPVRMELLDLLRREGELTATRAAEALGESPGNMSWHLQTLAKYGFVEEAPGGKGRSRPWRLLASSNRFQADAGDPVAGAAGDVLVVQFIDRAVQKQREWMAQRASFAQEWRERAFLTGKLAYLTAAELAELGEEIAAILERYGDRHDRGKRPADALPVQVTAFGHPLPPTPSGN